MKNPRPTTRPITFSNLRRHFTASGYRVVLRQSQTMNRLAKLRLVKTRTYEQQTLGLIMPDVAEIAINRSLPLHERSLTLLHEMVHLYDHSISESETERRATNMYEDLSQEEIGWLEFVVSI